MSQQMIIAVLATLAVGGAAWALIYPLISGQARAEKRMNEITVADVEARRARKGADQATPAPD
jgi:tight adherence protein B